MTPDWSLDVGVAPEGALARVSAAINRRSKRALGVLKTENEFVGVVGDGGFEIWERYRRAVHAHGRIRGRRGGSRIELRFVLTARTRVLGGIFFVLYAIAAGGIALRGPEPGLSLDKLAVAIAGAAALALIFTVGARKQRADLRSFVDRLFADLPRI